MGKFSLARAEGVCAVDGKPIGEGDEPDLPGCLMPYIDRCRTEMVGRPAAGGMVHAGWPCSLPIRGNMPTTSVGMAPGTRRHGES